MTISGYKTRFCPSPTGLMHLGNLRTALFNDFLAKSLSKEKSTQFLLRIEDTDLARSETSFTEKLMADLKWMGIFWQEGPGCEGENGPYFQAQREHIYEEYYQALIKAGRAYWCFCTDVELTIARKSQLAGGMAPRYAGTCRHLTAEQIAEKKAKGLVPALRFKIPDNESIVFEDFIQGPKNFATNDIGDFIIKKADNSASFMFCNAVDDALMAVTHVMRGEDHLTNTPRQLLILQALGLRSPLYGHMPLIIGFDGKPLSKRNGSQSVEELRNRGYFPLAIANYLARLGHHFEKESLLSLSELGENFSSDNIGRSPARFDNAQLDHWQKEIVLKLGQEEFWQWIAPTVSNWVKPLKKDLFVETIKQNIILPEEAKEWAQQLLSDEFSLSEEAKTWLNEAGKAFADSTFESIEQAGEDYAAVQKLLSEKTQRKGKSLFKPLRALITGRGDGPELAKIFSLMGKELLLERVQMSHRLTHAANL